MSVTAESPNKAKEYWDIVGKNAPDNCKDHWVDGSGNPLPETLYQEVGVYVLGGLDAMLEDVTSPRRVLEIGCGTGKILQVLKALRPELELFGIDFSQEQIRHASSNVPSAEFFTGDLDEFVAASAAGPGESGTYDLIYLHSVIQYFPSTEYFEKFLTLCGRLLRRGGALYLIDTPIDWYYDQMRGIPRQTALTPIKNLVKKLIGYQPKAQPLPLTAGELLGGKQIEVPTFPGYWASPEMIQQFAENEFEKFRFEYQLFKSKPVLYRKYRPSFLLLGKK
ncbi:class I SAM-dependent methyltransferase [Polaromonas sp. SM01]|uniref:class I SAM-dependent methyltransferase n=1 Tax=Polaromonas sp. SM01 TaxID=3085630 RepID=UPI0029813E73|nr:class I SAM-dependent methyltransferase [Polaromonas sp. SM01]MDW5443931.1 class I SAM-dependent methyltransferase [Polaromonas sp. SM01]